MSAGNRFEDFYTTAERLALLSYSPKARYYLGSYVYPAGSCFSKLTDDLLDDSRLFLSVKYTSPHCVAARLRRCKYIEMK